MLWNLADDGATSVEGLAERYRSEIVDVDVTVVGMTYGFLNDLEPCR